MAARPASFSSIRANIVGTVPAALFMGSADQCGNQRSGFVARRRFCSSAVTLFRRRQQRPSSMGQPAERADLGYCWIGTDSKLIRLAALRRQRSVPERRCFSRTSSEPARHSCLDCRTKLLRLSGPTQATRSRSTMASTRCSLYFDGADTVGDLETAMDAAKVGGTLDVGARSTAAAYRLTGTNGLASITVSGTSARHAMDSEAAPTIPARRFDDAGA